MSLYWTQRLKLPFNWNHHLHQLVQNQTWVYAKCFNFQLQILKTEETQKIKQYGLYQTAPIPNYSSRIHELVYLDSIITRVGLSNITQFANDVGSRVLAISCTIFSQNPTNHLHLKRTISLLSTILEGQQMPTIPFLMLGLTQNYLLRTFILHPSA